MRKETTGGFELLIEHAADYAVFTTDREGLVQEWNAGAERLHGFTAEEIRGRSCDILFVAEDREAGIPELERALALRSGRAENERWHVRKDGTRFWGAGQMLAMHGPDGGHVGFGKIMRDFTRRRELEARHIEAQRMEGVGVLAGGLAHLFNNLLTASLGNVEMMLAIPEVQQHASAQRHGREALKAGQRMVELTQQVLTYAGKARSLFQPLDLGKEAGEMLAALASRIPPHIHVRVDVGEACPAVTGDAALIRQLLAALVTNALEAMGEQPGPGSLTITGGPYQLAAEEASRFRGFDLLPGRYVRLEVSDTGPGLPSAAQARAFDPFYSTKFQGRGLGLAAALGIVRMHGGAIAVRSERGRGATFEVLLPVRDVAPSAGSTRWQPAAARESPEGLMALVVDDEELVRSLIVRFLETEGFTAVQAENGQQASRIAERLGSRIAVVVLDLVMPGMDGAETLSLLRSRLPDVPVVLMTGLASAEADVRIAALDIDARVVKPFTFDQLTTAVDGVLERRQRGAEVSRTTS
ncbi:MAG TPA: response regulator [Gemmatimonadales bacterium]|nr:response regulator [Gemmatimonadales bacterium]